MGGPTLVGDVRIRGAKNAVTKQLLASLLTDEPCVLQNVPRIGEVGLVLGVLRALGTRCRWLADDQLLVHTPRVVPRPIGPRHTRYGRLSPLLLPCLLHRTGEALVARPGGCPLGARSIDFHLQALTTLGATVDDRGGWLRATATRLRGTTLGLPYPSVGATENVLLAAVLAEGTTRLHNAAIEPEVLDTIAMLQAMGARIHRSGYREFAIEGVGQLHGVQHRVLPDRIEAASWAVAAAATGGRIRLVGIEPGLLDVFWPVFMQAGGSHACADVDVLVGAGPSVEGPLLVQTGPYPAFSTDWLLPLAVLLSQAKAPATLHETVFEERLHALDGLRHMGAHVELYEHCAGCAACRFQAAGHRHSARIRPARLHGADLAIPDLRAGFAYLTAALVADGASRLSNAQLLGRGYGNLIEQFRRLGAIIETG